MAAITSAVVVAAGSAYAANRQAGAAKDAANSQRDAASQGIGEQRRQFDTFQGNIKPYLGVGQTGIDGINALLKDPNSIQDSNAYKFRFDQGLQANDRSAAAGGRLFSGGHQADLLAYGQGMASQEYDNQWSRLMGLANMGQNSAVGAGQMGQNNANAISGLYGQQGNAAANGGIGSANAWSNGIAGITNAFGQYAGSRQSAYQPQQQSGWGAFTPNSSSSTASGWDGSSAFGQWGKGWNA